MVLLCTAGVEDKLSDTESVKISHCPDVSYDSFVEGKYQKKNSKSTFA